MKKCCGNCVYGDAGVCGDPTDSAGEIGTVFICENYKEREEYKFSLEEGDMCPVCGTYYFFIDGHRCQRL